MTTGGQGPPEENAIVTTGGQGPPEERSAALP